MQYLAKPRWSEQDRPIIRKILLKVIGVQIACLLAIGAAVMVTQGGAGERAMTVAAQASPAR